MRPPPAHEREREEQRANADEQHETRDRPGRDLGRDDHVGDEEHHGYEVEDAMCEHRADEGRPETLAPRQLACEHGDACELADAARQDCIRKEPYREGREHEQVARVRRRHRLANDGPPGDRARDDRCEIETNRSCDPLPADGGEGVADRAPARPAPPEQRADAGGDGQHEQNPDPGIRERAQPHAVTGARARPVTSS